MSEIIDTPTVTRVKTLGRAAEHAMAQNALLATENTRLLLQNQGADQTESHWELCPWMC